MRTQDLKRRIDRLQPPPVELSPDAERILRSLLEQTRKACTPEEWAELLKRARIAQGSHGEETI